MVDAFNLSDYIVNTPLGCREGDIYVKFFDKVKSLNPQGKHKYFERTIKPLFTRK